MWRLCGVFREDDSSSRTPSLQQVIKWYRSRIVKCKLHHRVTSDVPKAAKKAAPPDQPLLWGGRRFPEIFKAVRWGRLRARGGIWRSALSRKSRQGGGLVEYGVWDHE
eukprot:6017910-Prymnesium_polylepis.1